jgi:anti-sigma B factor antagonist
MKLKIEDSGGVSVVTFDGSILQDNLILFRTRLNDLLENKKFNILLDMSRTQYISSVCLAVMVDLKEKTSSNGGDLKIACPNALIKNLLEITNLVKKIEVFDSIEEAVNSFKLIL